MGEQGAAIHVETAQVLAHQEFADDQHILRLRAARCAQQAQPGQFIHLQCDPKLPMRRPYSILSASPQAGWVEIFFRVVGTGSRLLAAKRRADRLSCIGPIGTSFALDAGRDRPLLIGGGTGLPPILFFASELRRSSARPALLLGSERPVPFELRESELPCPGVPDGCTASLRMLDEWGLPARLASSRGRSGWFKGHVHELAEAWLGARSAAELARVELFACGPGAMLEAVAAVSGRYGLPCCLCFEEFMACAVGGCAGCAIAVRENGRHAMKRVCVDGPVFDARLVYPQHF